MNRVYCNFITPTIRQQAHRLGINPSILNNIISTMKSVSNNPNIDTSDNAINTFINNNKDKIKEIKLSLPYYKSIPLSTNYNKLTSTIMGSITIRTFNDNFPSSDWINHTYKSEFMLNNLDLFDSPRAIYTYELYLEKLCIENNVDLSKLSSTERNKYIDSAIRALKEVKETYPDEFEVKSNTINIKDGNSNVNVEYKIVSNIKGNKFATIKGNTVSIREAVSTNEIRHYLAGDTDEFRKKVMQNLKNRGYNISSIYEAMGDKNNIAKFLISSMYSHLKNNDTTTYNKLDENGKLDIETRATEDGLNSIGIYPKTISTPVRSTNIADYVNIEGEDKGFLTKKGEELLSTTFDKNKFNKGTFSVALYPGPAGTILSIGFISPKGNKFYAEYSSSPTRKTWDLSNSKQQNITDVTSEKYWNIINTIVPKSLRDLVDSGEYYKMDTTDTEKGGEASFIKRSELEDYFEKEYNVFMQGRSLDYNTKQINKALSPVQETKKPKTNPFNISKVNDDKRKQYARDSGITIKSIESPTSKDLEDYSLTEITIVTTNGNRIQVAPQAGFQDLNKESKTIDIKGLIGINYLLENYLLTHPSEVNKFGGSVLSSHAKDIYGDKYDASKDNFKGDYTAYIEALTSSSVQKTTEKQDTTFTQEEAPIQDTTDEQDDIPLSYEGYITPSKDTIFVFGSNPEGRHGAGAAKVAREQFGAKYGVGEGITGNSYALPTKDLRVKVNNSFRSISPKDIINNIRKLYETAKSIPSKQFKVAYRNGMNERTLNGYTGEELVSFFKAAGELPKNIQISEEWSKYWNDVQPYDVTKDTVEISGPVTIDISKEDNDNTPMIGEQGNLVLDIESPYVRMSRVFTATELTDRTNDIAREFSSQLDSLYEDLLDEYENRIAEASTTEDKRKLEQDLALLKEDNGRKIAINKIGFSVIVDNIKASYSDVLDYDDETIREIYNTDPNIIRTKIQNTLDYFEYLLEDACNIIEMNEGIRITIDKHMFNDGTKNSEIIDGGIADTEQETNDEDEQIGDNENGEAVSGNDGWSFKVREVSPHDSISKGTKSVLRDIKKIRPDGSVDIDDLGKVRYVREDIAHATLINALSDMIDPDDFSKLENGNYRLLALERVAQKYPWVNQVIDKLLEEPRLISLFYTDFRKDFISYWTQKYNKDKGLIENIPLNQSVAIDSTITDVIRNYENKDMMSEDSIYDSNGKIVKENADKGINNVDKAFKLIKTLDEDELDNIYKYINDSLRMVGFNTKVNDVSYLYDNVNGRNNLITLVRNLREIFEKAKDLGENEHLIDSLKEQYKNLAELVGTVTELDNIQSFRVNGKSYYSYSAPNYVNTQIKTFLNDAKRQNYLDTEFKAYNWFYNKDNKTWKNEWLRQIESDADVRNHIAIKEINVLDKDSYNDWKPNQIKEAFLEEYLSIPENKGSKKQYAWYNFPIFSDSPVAMFIRFTKYIDDNEGTFKQKLLPLFRQIVYQEMERIKLCENRDKSGVMKIQNFDKRGKIFNFFPELNTNKYGKSQISFKEAIQYYADDKEGLDKFIDMAINEIMDKNFEEFLKSYNNDDLLIQVKRTGVVTTDEAALNKLEEYFWNQSFATSQIIQITTTDLAYYKDGVDFQKRFKEIYAAGSKLNTNSKYGRKIERTIYLKDNIITSANYIDIKSNIMQAVKEKRLSKEEGLAILDKFKDINQTDAQAYRSLSSYRAVLDMMGLWTDDMQRAFDNLQKGIYDSRDFDIVWQTIKPFVFTQIDKNDGLGGHIKVPHQNKNSEFLLLAAYDILNSVMNKSPKFVGLNRFMEDKGIDVIQFESAVKAGGEGIIDISVSQNKVNKVVRDQAITLGNITIPLEGVKDWKTIKKAFDDALDNNNISQDDYNTVMKYFEPTSDEVYKILNNAACKPVLDTDIIEDGYNTSVVHSIPYKDYVVQTPTPEHLFDASSIYGSQYRNLILSDISDDMEITINGKTFKGKEIKDFYNSLIIENLLEDFRNIRGYFDSIQDLQKELLSMVKGNPKYGRDMLNALQIVKRNINGVEREVFNLPLHNPSTTTKIQELVNSIFKNHITKQKIKGGKATLASNFGFTRDLKILREEDGSIIGAECYLPFYSKKYFEPILVDVKDKEGNIIGQKLDINRLDPELRKLLGFRIPTENLYSMLPMIIKGFLPQQNGSSIMLPADITQIAGEDFDVDGRFLFLPESKLEWYDYKRAFRDYKNSHSVDNNGNIALADKNGVLSSLLEELGGKEQLTDSEVSFTEWFKANKDDYKLDKPKLKKIRYNMNKAPKDNSRAARNNMLIDLGYSILSAKESAERINSPGNFDKAKAEARRADILKDNELVNTYMEINSITKLSEVGPKLLKESLDSLNNFMSKYKKERNPLSVDTFIYNHHQNTTGGKLIGIYANNNTAHAKFQSTRLGIAEANQFKIDGTIFSSLSSKTTNINGINESILSNCAQLSAASVDNVKDPVLASLLQNENTASIGGTMLAMGMSLQQMGLLFIQPIVRKYIESSLNNLKLLENEINGLCKNYHIVLEDLKNDTTSEELVNNILYYNRLDWDKITPENIQDYSVEDKKASDILKDVVIATYKWYNIALIARDYSDLIRISRADSPNGAMKRNIAQTTNQLHNIDRFLVNSFKVDFTLTNTEDCVRNNVVKLTDTEEEMRTKLNKRPMSMLQAFHSLGINLGSSLESKVFMQLSDNVKTMVNILYNNSAYNTISDKLLDNFYSDLTKFALSKTKIFGNDGTRTFDEKRDYYLYKFPKKFLEFKLNPKNKEITNLGIIKKLSVKRGKIIMDNSGKITGALREMFMRDFEKLLYMDNPDARQFATDLLAYSFYLDGLNFGPNSYGNFFSTIFLNSYPELVNALSAMETDINSNMYADYLNQFYANYWKEEGLLPTYRTDTQNQPAKSIDGSILIPKKICANSNVIDETYYPLIKLEVTNKLTGESETTLYSYDENFDSEKSKRYYPVKVHNPNQGVKYNANMTAVEMADIETDENLIKENRELDINNIELVGQTLEDEIGNNPKEETPIPVDDSISILSSDLAEQLGDLADIQSDMVDFINQGRNDSGIINC